MRATRGRKRSRDDDTSFDAASLSRATKIQRRNTTRRQNSNENEKKRESLTPEEIALSILSLSDAACPLTPTKTRTSIPLDSTFSPSLKAACQARAVATPPRPLKPANVQILKTPPVSSPALTSSVTLSGDSFAEDSPVAKKTQSGRSARRRLSQIEAASFPANIKIKKLENGKSTRKPPSRAQHALLYVF